LQAHRQIISIAGYSRNHADMKSVKKMFNWMIASWQDAVRRSSALRQSV
jgi:hypothetical protein